MRNLPVAIALVLLVAAAGCTSQRTVGQPNLSVVQDTVSVVHRDKVDILFMVDNSPSMAPKQAALRATFPTLVQRIQDMATTGAPASFHIGVVDSDLGAGPFTLNQGQCHPGGNGGKLHTSATAGVANLPANCTGFQLDAAAPYIDYDSNTGVSNTGTLSVADAFTCLASVGDVGCGFEAPLESVYQALTSPALNPGFLRDDALLVVVWLTDEDDCSAPPDSPLFDPSATGIGTYGTLHSYRCTQFGVACDGKPLGEGSYAAKSCEPAPGGPLYDVSRYTSLFASGGIKANTNDVLLVSIAAPPAPFTVEVTMPCQDVVNAASCPVLDHSCMRSSSIFGDPAVRLGAVTSATANAVTGSICADDYGVTLQSVADAMSARMRAGCLPGAVVDVLDPGCRVTVDGDDTPRCGVGTNLPCWDILEDDGCPARPSPAGAAQHLRFTIEGAAPGASISAVCPLYEPAT